MLNAVLYKINNLLDPASRILTLLILFTLTAFTADITQSAVYCCIRCGLASFFHVYDIGQTIGYQYAYCFAMSEYQRDLADIAHARILCQFVINYSRGTHAHVGAPRSGTDKLKMMHLEGNEKDNKIHNDTSNQSKNKINNKTSIIHKALK